MHQQQLFVFACSNQCSIRLNFKSNIFEREDHHLWEAFIRCTIQGIYIPISVSLEFSGFINK